jgi:hypothetical protein
LTQTIACAAAGFLLAVLWFDLMFDVQVWRHRQESLVPDQVLASVAGYYRRVTTTASPMGRLVAAVMLVLIATLVVQVARGDVAVWVSVVSFVAGGVAMGLALVRLFGAARRLGRREDTAEVQSALARGLLRGHAVCLVGMAVVLGVQVGGVG